MTDNKHENYEILNLIGYGLAKFDIKLVKSFGFKYKLDFYDFLVASGVGETIGTIKNRQDLFDPFFNNGRKGWWQKGNTYLHRKLLIDSLFGSLNFEQYSNILKLYICEKFNVKFDIEENIEPIIKSKFRKLQETGLEAELYFINNYNFINIFQGGIIQDARLLGDGYDFQIERSSNFYLAEIKGIRKEEGNIRLTQNEYKKAQECKNNYFVVVVSRLEESPKFTLIEDPVKNLQFEKRKILSHQIYYQTSKILW